MTHEICGKQAKEIFDEIFTIDIFRQIIKTTNRKMKGRFDGNEYMRYDEFQAFIFALFYLSTSGADTHEKCWNTDPEY